VTPPQESYTSISQHEQSHQTLHLTRTNPVHQGLQTEFIPVHDTPRRPRQQNLHPQTRLHPHCKYRYVENRPTINGHRNQALLNPANLRENLDMGDSLHEIISSAPENPDQLLTLEEAWKQQTIRIYFQNVNGLRMHDAGADIIDTFVNLNDIQVDIFGIAETKLHCRSQTVQGMIQNCKRRVWRHAKVYTSSSDEEWNETSKPGGTLLGVTGSLVGRIKSHTADKYGRWIQVDLLSRSGRIISVICAYQVVQEVGRHGNLTTYSQQVRMMRMEGQLKPDPRRQLSLI
jgi:hypothetical protein